MIQAAKAGCVWIQSLIKLLRQEMLFFMRFHHIISKNTMVPLSAPVSNLKAVEETITPNSIIPTKSLPSSVIKVQGGEKFSWIVKLLS